MRYGRARLVLLAALVVASALVLRAQRGAERHLIFSGLGLPAVDEGVILNEIRAPGTPEDVRRAAMRGLRDETGLSPRYAAGRVLVKFREQASEADRLSAVRDASSTAAIDPRPSYADFDVVRIDPAEDAEAVAAALQARPEVEYAQASYRVHPMFVPNDPLYRSLQWNLPLINMERAWDLQPQAGSSIVVAVLDTGVAYMNATLIEFIPAFTIGRTRYPQLGTVTIPYSAATQLVAPGRFVAPHDFIWDNDTPLDFDGHGTHVSGTIGQLTNDGIGTAGVAFNVKIMPVKVIDSDWDFLFGAPNSATDEVVARGIRYAADNKANVINMSIGRNGPPNTAPAIEDAIKYAVGKGVFVAIAGGNGFEEGNQLEVLAEIANRVQGAVSVAAVDPARQRAFYSTTGPYIEIAAPGGSDRGFGVNGAVFQQTFDDNFTNTFLRPPSTYAAPRFDIFGFIPYEGTSMATPHVSGLAAMMMQQGITNPAAVEAAMEQTAIDLGPAGRDDQFGFGLIDARAALRGSGLAAR
jgi:serine protease